jgi:hypothetical protein
VDLDSRLVVETLPAATGCEFRSETSRLGCNSGVSVDRRCGLQASQEPLGTP